MAKLVRDTPKNLRLMGRVLKLLDKQLPEKKK